MQKPLYPRILFVDYIYLFCLHGNAKTYKSYIMIHLGKKDSKEASSPISLLIFDNPVSNPNSNLIELEAQKELKRGEGVKVVKIEYTFHFP